MKHQYLGARGKKLTWLSIATVVLPAYFLAGYSNAVPGGLLDLDSWIETFPQIDTVHKKGAAEAEAARIQGTAVAIYLVGCVLGALSCLKLGDKVGRIRTMIIGNMVNMCGSIIIVSSFSLGQLIAGRLVLGLGLGAVASTVPAWQAECSPAKNRGALVTLEAAFATVGLAASQFIDLGCFFSKTSLSWRFPLAVPILCNFTMLCVLPFLPESPRWLVKKGRIEEAKEITAVLEDQSSDSPQIADDITAMKQSLETMGTGSFGGLIRDKGNKLKLRTLLAMFSTFSQQMNGAGLIGFYTVSIFAELGLAPIVTRVLAGCIFVFQLPCCFLCCKLVDRVGRRFLLLLGAGGMGTVFVVLSGTMSQLPGNQACSIVAAVAIFFYTFFFGVSYGINWLFPAEVAPLAYRTQIYALTTATQFGINFMVVEVTPLGINNLGWKFFIIWAAVCLGLLFPVTYLFFPETTGHTLEDIDHIFKTAKGAFDLVSVSKAVRRDGLVHQSGTTDIHALEEGPDGGLSATKGGAIAYEVDDKAKE